MNDLEQEIETIRLRNIARIKGNYRLARELGCTSYEAGILSQRSEKNIREYAKKYE